MIIGYQISAQDDDSFMLGKDTFKPMEKNPFYEWRFGTSLESHPATCKKCGRKIDPHYVNPDFKVKKRKKDLVYTYDGYLLVSMKFRERIISLTGEKNDFVPLPQDREYFWCSPKSLIEFDTEKRQTRFEKFCDQCNSFHDVVGANPIFLKNGNPLKENRVFRTDVEFGSGHEQHPLVIIGPGIYSKLREESFSGIEYQKIDG